jgi:hypothetical protein
MRNNEKTQKNIDSNGLSLYLKALHFEIFLTPVTASRCTLYPHQ